LNWKEWLEPAQDWRSLWEDTATRQELNRQLQATSTVAFLVDTYGWASFLKFLKSLPASQSYRQSLAQAYELDLTRLEAGWQAYYPGYFRERWQSHPLYNYDLESYETLIREEKYLEAGSQLQAVIEFLEKVRQPERAEQARLLLQMARKGQEADALMAQSRQSFYSGDYPSSLALLVQAERKYGQIGNLYRLDELYAYRDQVHKVLRLHAELAHMQGLVRTHWNTLSLSAQLVSLGSRLSDLGDTHGHAQVREMAQVIEARQRGQHILLSLAALVIVLALLGIRVRLLWRNPAPEAQL
jgi:hypothetical protein